MLEKQEFYRGAAVVRVLDHPLCRGLKKNGSGYLVNTQTAFFLKYSTKANSPWPFNLTTEDIQDIGVASNGLAFVLLALVCGGDGVCPVSLSQLGELTNNQPGWISVRRPFGGSYGVSGIAGRLRRKVPVNSWPALVFAGVDGGLHDSSNQPDDNP
jgi:hypothetical protein